MFTVDEDRDSGMKQEIGGGICCGLVAAVENDLYMYAPFMIGDNGFGDRGGGETISLDKDARLGGFDFLDDGLGTTALRREVNLNRRQRPGRKSIIAAGWQ
jgi:hypothetical protein